MQTLLSGDDVIKARVFFLMKPIYVSVLMIVPSHPSAVL